MTAMTKRYIDFSAREAAQYQRRYPGSIVRHAFNGLGLECIWL